ncbi:MAG: deoxyribose-phosphate aldolase [Oscillospiraceae bacterium]|nr:deoxyribose-phosphate aldolase [Oscillospiraceae bacterium]
MNKEIILSKVDHTQLKPYADFSDIKKLCEEAIANNMASVCIPPSYVKRAKEIYSDDLTVCTVVGFPLGYSTTRVKVFETRCAVEDGADEIDTVINIGDVKNKDFDKIENELRQIRAACKSKIMKVIIETCYLTKEEKITLCRIVTDVEADFIKTSTGFGTGGATLSDIELLRNNIGFDVRIKAAGGIRTKEEFMDFEEAGCDRIGSSSALTVLRGDF